MYELIKGYKTVSFAVAVSALGAAQTLLPSVQAVITPDVYGYLTISIGVVVAALRTVTTTPLGGQND
jgi:hypothetical protein